MGSRHFVEQLDGRFENDVQVPMRILGEQVAGEHRPRIRVEFLEDLVGGDHSNACCEQLDPEGEAADRAASHGLDFDRTACVNDDATIMAALAERVRAIAP